MPGSRRVIALTFVAVFTAAFWGCSFLKPVVDAFAFRPISGNGSQNALPPIRPALDALQIDLCLVDRPLGDPLLGTTLWSDIVEVGTVAPNERESLKRLGLRVGNAGATPSPSLERILQLSSDPFDAADAKNRESVHRHRFYVRPSEDAPIETNTVTKCTIDVPLESGTKEKTYENFKGVLKMTTHRLQDGWARLEFVPEIHYGKSKWRGMPDTVGASNAWQPKESQEVDPLLSQHFSVKMHVGEMVVITAEQHRPRTFGHYSFVLDESKTAPLQRVLVVRLSNMARFEPIYTQSNLTSQSPAARQ